MPTINEILQTMDYGPAPESTKEAQAWLDQHGRRFGLFIDNAWSDANETFATTNINSISSSISVSAGNTLNLGTVTRGTGATFDFTSTGSGTLAAATASNTGGIMPGLTFGDSWAVANGAGVPTVFAGRTTSATFDRSWSICR